MAAVKEAKQAEPLPYRMPKPCVGDPVVWHLEGDKNAGPNAARVIAVHTGCIDLVYDAQDSQRRVLGCHHVDDPRWVENPAGIRSRGGWDFSPFYKKIMALDARVADLESIVK